MKSGQRNEMPGEIGRRDAPRLPCSTRSAEILLAFLILVSLNIVAVYDWFLSKVLRLAPRQNTATSFDTTHISKGFARRVRPPE
jgi:hypothetical protein